MGKSSSERSEKARKLDRITYASGGHEPWAWMETGHGPADFDDSAECWGEEARKSWGVETMAGQAWLAAGAVVCGLATMAWVGWVVWLVVGKG